MNGWPKRNTISKHVCYFGVVASTQLSPTLAILSIVITESSPRLEWDLCKISLKVSVMNFILFFKKYFIIIYLKDRGNEREHEQWGEVEAGSLLSREPSADSILGPWNHDLSPRQTLNQLSHPEAPWFLFLSTNWFPLLFSPISLASGVECLVHLYSHSFNLKRV